MWFGENWNAPVCKSDQQVSVPVGERCVWCDEVFVENDCGISMPSPEGFANFHLNCMLRTVFGSASHITMGPHRCGECGGDSPELTKREAADAAVRAYHELYKYNQ